MHPTVWNDKHSLLERQTHGVIFEGRVKQVRSAAEWSQWVWMWPWMKLSLTQLTPALTHPVSCHTDTTDPSAHSSWFYWAKQKQFKPHSSHWEGSQVFVCYRMRNTEMVCFGKQHYCMNVSWNEPAWKKQSHSNGVWVGSSSAHPHLFPPHPAIYAL